MNRNEQTNNKPALVLSGFQFSLTNLSLKWRAFRTESIDAWAYPALSGIQPTTWSEFVWPANQHPKSTTKKQKPTNLCAPPEFLRMCRPCLITIQSCYFENSIKKPSTCSRCLICVLRSVHVISTRIVRKGSWAFYLNYPQINEVSKAADHTVNPSMTKAKLTKSKLSDETKGTTA